jgi:antitoxin PrlF
MGAESKITAKGQTTIPIEVREFLGLEAGDRIGYEIVDGKVTIVPKNRSALEFAGILHAPDRWPVSTLDEIEPTPLLLRLRQGASEAAQEAQGTGRVIKVGIDTNMFFVRLLTR